MLSSVARKTAVRMPMSGTRAFSAAQVQKLAIYRYDPEKQNKPFLQTYDVNLKETGPMLLNALVKIKK